MGAGQILALRRAYWGVETGLHSRLGISTLEDKSRVRLLNNAIVLAVLRCLSVSLACNWMKRQLNPRQANLLGFFEAMRSGKAFELAHYTTTLSKITPQACGIIIHSSGIALLCHPFQVSKFAK
jgi:hypothetical protein